MSCITVKLSPRALAFLRRKVPTARGVGVYLTELLVIEQAREEMRAERERDKLVERQDWDRTGLCVD